MHFSLKNLHLSIGEEFCSFPYQKMHISFSPLEWRWGAPSPLPKWLQSSKQFAFFVKFALSNGKYQEIEAAKQTIKFPAAPSFFSSKKWIKLIPKAIGNRKRDCAWGCARGINTIWENLQIEKHKSGRRSFRSQNWFVHFDLQIFSDGVFPRSAISFSISNFDLQISQMVLIPRVQPHAQYLFLLPISICRFFCQYFFTKMAR